MSDCIIYGLKCPIDDVYKYIGKSSIGMKRPKQHLVLSHNENIRIWVDELREIGMCPIIEVIEECEKNDLTVRESYWVNYYHNNVNPLMNKCTYEGKNVINLEKKIKEKEEYLNKKLNSITKDIDKVSTFHGLLKYVRKERGVTQETLSDISGVSLRAIKKIETGKGNPTFKTLKNIFDALGFEIAITLKK